LNDRFSKNIQISNFIKIIPMASACFTRMDRRTHTCEETNSRFSKFWEGA